VNIAHDLVTAWCQMWNDDADLARELASDDFRVWFGRSDAGSAITGAGDLAQFVGRYQRDKGARFTPRLVVWDERAQRLAFTWDASFPDGSAVGGIDICDLRDGLITRNWSVGGERPSTIPGLPAGLPASGSEASRTAAGALCEAWSPMWNGDTGLARELVTDDFRIWFGGQQVAADDLTGPDALAAYISRHREHRAGLRFAKHGAPVIDGTGQAAAFTWTASLRMPDGESRQVGGIDLLQLSGGRFSRCWSVTGTAPIAF
jgi:hypothetical protein